MILYELCPYNNVFSIIFYLNMPSFGITRSIGCRLSLCVLLGIDGSDGEASTCLAVELLLDILDSETQ
jgi:hypothetical protein